MLVCREDVDAVAKVAAEWIRDSPEQDVRLAGYTRDTLRRIDGAPAPVCHLADLSPVAQSGPPEAGACLMQVRDGMNEIVVTVGPDHTLREAARRMRGRSVGAAVVFDADQGGPGIITERDLLASNGLGQDVDHERVRDHLTTRLVHAPPIGRSSGPLRS